MYHYGGGWWKWGKLGMCGSQGYLEISVPSPQYCYESKMALKK